MAKKPPEVKGVYSITHVANLPSILERGILCHRIVTGAQVPCTPIYDTAIVANRHGKVLPDGKNLWDFANLYFQPRNPMLYRVLREKQAAEIAIVAVQPGVLHANAAFVALGNAASSETPILPASEARAGLAELWPTLTSDWWNGVDGSKRKIMAELLVPERVPPGHIQAIYVASASVADSVKQACPSSRVPVIPEPHMFFLPARRYPITERLSLVDGDMFFSNMHTLTVSVNVVGVMGKGLASRAKYQFPDVYVVYQDVCRSKALRMGRPYLYKREAYLDDELAADPATLSQRNANKWFLLFATKKHWRERSDLAGIEAGLRWVREHYRTQGIRSLAMPALGCGLGQLEWRDVGPLMCRELSQLDVQVAIYLPRENQLQPEYLDPRYLLR